MNTRAGSAPSADGAPSLGSIETAAAAVSALQGASSPTVGLSSMPSAFEGAAGSGPFACLPGFAGLAAGAGSRAASIGGSPSMPAPQALPPPPPPPQSPAAPSPAITPRASMAPSPAVSAAGLPHVSLGAEDTNALLASMKVRSAALRQGAFVRQRTQASYFWAVGRLSIRFSVRPVENVIHTLQVSGESQHAIPASPSPMCHYSSRSGWTFVAAWLCWRT